MQAAVASSAAATPSDILEAIFGNGEDGFVFQPGVSAMYQDDGTATPATANGDRVRRVYDARGTGKYFRSISDALRPTYRPNAGFPYLEFDGTNSMDWDGGGGALTDFNFGQISVHGRFQSNNAGSAIIMWPHNTTHTSPFLRFGIFDNFTNRKLITRIDGTSYQSTPDNVFGSTLRPMVGVSAPDGVMYRDGAVLTSDASGATVTYPNSRGVLIGTNASGGEKMTGRVYGLVFFNRQTNPRDVFLLNKWVPSA